MSRYLLDTNILSYFVSGRHPEIVDLVLSLPVESRFINWVVQQELLYGVYRKNRLDLEIKYEKFFKEMKVIHSNDQIVKVCSKLEADLDAKGQVKGLEDIWIAASCVAEDLILVTKNKKDFEVFEGLRVYDLS